jgi:hypothetical protein
LLPHPRTRRQDGLRNPQSILSQINDSEGDVVGQPQVVSSDHWIRRARVSAKPTLPEGADISRLPDDYAGALANILRHGSVSFFVCDRTVSIN